MDLGFGHINQIIFERIETRSKVLVVPSQENKISGDISGENGSEKAKVIIQNSEVELRKSQL